MDAKKLRLKIFEKIDKPENTREDRNWLVTRNISGKDSLSVGNNGPGIEIFLEKYGVEEERYFLEDMWTKKRPDWLKPSIEFLQQTHGLLPVSSQQEFYRLCLKEKQ